MIVSIIIVICNYYSIVIIGRETDHTNTHSADERTRHETTTTSRRDIKIQDPKVVEQIYTVYPNRFNFLEIN